MVEAGDRIGIAIDGIDPIVKTGLVEVVIEKVPFHGGDGGVIEKDVFAIPGGGDDVTEDDIIVNMDAQTLWRNKKASPSPAGARRATADPE